MLSIQEISEVPTRKVLTSDGLWNVDLMVAICNVLVNTKTQSTSEPGEQTLTFLSMSNKPELTLIVEVGFEPRMLAASNSFRLERERRALKGICAEFNLRYEEENDNNL